MVVNFQKVSKSYSIYDSPSARLTELLTFNRLKRHRDFWALQDIDLQISKGETFCLIGENGSGKSTLLQIIAGILQPSSGSAEVNGKVAALLELGSGFNPEFTGHDNVFLNGAILGMSKEEMVSLYDRIIEFAEIGDFIHQPVKTYSSGMVVRLAFAVAIHVNPEILLVDEALAVGDIYFRQRCLRKVHELRQQGVTILFVSHSMGDVKAIGDRTLWLDHGRIREIGATDMVVSKYLAAMDDKDARYVETHIPTEELEGNTELPSVVVRTIPNIDHRHGDGRAEVIGIAIIDENSQPVHLMEPEMKLVVRISVEAKQGLSLPNVGFMMRNHLGLDFFGTNTMREGHQMPPMMKGEIRTVDFHLTLPQFYPGAFSFSPAIADGILESYKMCDWIDNAITLQMGHGEGQVYGFLHVPCRVEVNARA